MANVKVIGNQQGQQDFLEDWAPGFVLYQGGLGSGKTWAAARKFLMLHAYNKCNGLVSAPTVGDLFRFCVPEIVAACKEWKWNIEVYPGGRMACRFPHMIIWGKIVYLISAEDPSRFAGFEVGHIWIDEAARLKQNDIDPLKDAPTQIRTRLRTNAPLIQCILSTTPEGTETWVQDCWFDKPRDNHRYYLGDTEKNPELPAQYINDLKAGIASNLIDQYLKGLAATITKGIAHPTFNKTENMRDFEWDPRLPVHIGMDFNVEPMGWVAFQLQGKHVCVLDEMWIEDYALVDDGMENIKDKGWGTKGRGVVFHPDKASSQRSTTGDSEFVTIQELARKYGWEWSGDAEGANPPVNLRISNLSRLICNALGERRLFVHSRCTYLIEDLERTTRKKQGGYDPGKKNKRGHILDGLGYGTWDTASPKQRVTAGNLPTY